MGKKETTAVSRFPGINSLRSLTVLAKNAARGADDAFATYTSLSKEVNDLVAQIARLRTPVNADKQTADSLSEQRAKLRDQRDSKDRIVKLSYDRGLSLERAYDEYAYLLKRLTGEEVNLRKGTRFNNEVKINVSEEELIALCNQLIDEDKAIAAKNLGVKLEEPKAEEKKPEAKTEEKPKAKAQSCDVKKFLVSVTQKWYLVFAALVVLGAIIFGFISMCSKPVQQIAAPVQTISQPEPVKTETIKTEVPKVETVKAETEVEPKAETEVPVEKKAEEKQPEVVEKKAEPKAEPVKTEAPKVKAKAETKDSAKQPKEPKSEGRKFSDGEVNKKDTRYHVTEAPDKYSDYQRSYIFPVWSRHNIQFGISPLGWMGVDYYKDHDNEPEMYSSSYGLGANLSYEYKYSDSVGLYARASLYGYFVTFIKPADIEGYSKINVVVVDHLGLDGGVRYHKYVKDKVSFDFGADVGISAHIREDLPTKASVSFGAGAGASYYFMEQWSVSLEANAKLYIVPFARVPELSEVNYVINPLSVSFRYSF